ncbi:hypothetical protein DdX_14372 [Ditylenchus destructor]|uniref:Uncharacterized protein n=1 Tax=Ditylenchus destructor TaxID=166010 RepID=A0AAD4MX56_9BILA|nr:hypothetical protein DdX_14372 [Ditylenchus destructor]
MLSNRPKKTIVVKKVERRTPDGKLISTTRSKTVYLIEPPPVEANIAPIVTTQYMRPTLPIYNDEEYEEDSGYIPKYSRPRVPRFLDSSLTEDWEPKPTIYNYKWEPRRIMPKNGHENGAESWYRLEDLDERASTRTKYVDWRNEGDSTLFGDDWSSTDGTFIKQSHLVRRSDPLECCRRDDSIRRPYQSRRADVRRMSPVHCCNERFRY